MRNATRSGGRRGAGRTLRLGPPSTFFSSFGQTFLISLFVPSILVGFSLGTGSFGLLYAAATVGSAGSLPALCLGILPPGLDAPAGCQLDAHPPPFHT